MRRLSRTLLPALVVSIPLGALACPDCAEGIRRQVRAGIFDGSFSRNLAIAALPFGVLAGIAAAIHRGGARRGEHG